jgi:hypothetical protein
MPLVLMGERACEKVWEVPWGFGEADNESNL